MKPRDPQGGSPPPPPDITHLFHRLSNAFKHNLKLLEMKVFKTCVVLALISSKSSNGVPFSTDLSLVNGKKSQGARSGYRVGVAMWEYFFHQIFAYCERWMCHCIRNKFCTQFRICSLAWSSWRIVSQLMHSSSKSIRVVRRWSLVRRMRKQLTFAFVVTLTGVPSHSSL